MNPLIVVCLTVVAIIVVGALTMLSRRGSKGGRP